MTKPTEDDINNVMNIASEMTDAGENPYWGMTYIQGVRDALMWVQDGGEPPLNEGDRP